MVQLGSKLGFRKKKYKHHFKFKSRYLLKEIYNKEYQVKSPTITPILPYYPTLICVKKWPQQTKRIPNTSNIFLFEFLKQNIFPSPYNLPQTLP